MPKPAPLLPPDLETQFEDLLHLVYELEREWRWDQAHGLRYCHLISIEVRELRLGHHFSWQSR